MFVTSLQLPAATVMAHFRGDGDQVAERYRRFVLRGVAFRPKPICFAKSDRA